MVVLGLDVEKKEFMWDAKGGRGRKGEINIG
jgi:hypothetical protein